MFPLKQRTLIRGCKAHIDDGLGCAGDYVAKIGTTWFIPKDGDAYEPYAAKKGEGQGGWWAGIKRSNGDRIELAHLEHRFTKTGLVSEGSVGGTTGNTGTITTGEHLHLQVFDKNGIRLDPEKYLWNTVTMPTCEEQLAQEKSDHVESIKEKELNYQRWQTTLDQFKSEQAAHKETHDKLTACEAERETLRAEVRQLKEKATKAIAILA